MNDIPPGDERLYRLRWMAKIGQRLRARQTFAALLKTDPVLPGNIPRIHPNEGRDNRWDDQAPFHSLRAPCDGILSWPEEFNGKEVEHGIKIGVFYGFPTENWQHAFHLIDDGSISDVGEIMFNMDINRTQPDLTAESLEQEGKLGATAIAIVPDESPQNKTVKILRGLWGRLKLD